MNNGGNSGVKRTTENGIWLTTAVAVEFLDWPEKN